MERKYFGLWIKELREERGMTLQEVAERAKFTPQYLSDLERGRSMMPNRPGSVRRIVEALEPTDEQRLALANDIAASWLERLVEDGVGVSIITYPEFARTGASREIPSLPELDPSQYDF